LSLEVAAVVVAEQEGVVALEELYIKLISYLALAHITLLLVTVEDKTLLVEALA
jgi:hypothetical protein